MISQFFILQELVPPDIYNQFGDKSIWFLDSRMIKVADFLRGFVGQPGTINNWDSGGTLTLRGYRPPDTSIGGRLSQHKFGRAADFNFTGKTPQEVYKLILDNEQVFLEAGLTTLENINATPTWLHCDVRYTGLSHILIVNP